MNRNAKRVAFGALLALAIANPAAADTYPYTFAYVPPADLGSSAPAPNTTAIANRLLGAQLADAVTTRILLNDRGTFERDPLARPFVRNDLSAVAGAVLTNLALRLAFRRAPRVLEALDTIETGAVLNNLRVIGDHVR